MSSFDIIKENKPHKTFRVASIIGKFDLQNEHIKEHFVGNIDLSKKWNVGVIYGHSGTGKSTIARELFQDHLIEKFDYNSDSILDDMPKNKTIEEITKAFNSVGFSSPPSWLKKYSVLSTGEKMRVNLARAILEDYNLFVFDEFTSVVDRNVAKIGSYAISKAVKRSNKKFIAISCHEDILEWLEPDWVFNTNTMKYEYTRGLLHRPKIEIQIYEQKGMWELFRKYHYLNTQINNASKQFIAYYNNEPCGFCAVLHFPHAKSKNIKRCTRLVVLPDYQGIGIGFKLLNYIAEYFIKIKYRFLITTTTPALINNFKKYNMWELSRVSRVSRSSSISTMQKTVSMNRYTTSWEYKKRKQNEYNRQKKTNKRKWATSASI